MIKDDKSEKDGVKARPLLAFKVDKDGEAIDAYLLRDTNHYPYLREVTGNHT